MSKIKMPDKGKRVRASKLERRDYKWIYLFLLPSVVMFLMFYFVPILTMFFTSFTKWDGFNAPVFNGLDNYTRLFSNPAFVISVRNLIAWSLIGIFLHVGFGVLVALILYHKPRGWKFTRAVFMIPNVISAAAWALIYKFIFNNEMGVLNNLIRMISPDFNVQWFYTSPYAFWAITFTWLFYAVIVTLVVLGDLMAIPEELNEAARIDGANEFRILWHLILPMALPIILTIGMYYAVDHWNCYLLSIYYITKDQLKPLQVILRRLLDASRNAADQELVPTETLKMAAVCYATAPIIVVYPFIQKYFVKGTLAGAVKG